MTRRVVVAIAVVLALPACTTSRRTPQGESAGVTAATTTSTTTTPPTSPPAVPPSGPAEPPSTSPESSSAAASASALPAPTAGPVPTTFGSGPAWPSAPRGPAPPAYGAVVTNRVAAITGGGTLAAGLLLPRLDANQRSPLVMTPCGHRVQLRSSDVAFVAPGSGGQLPKPASRVVVLIDPGHGGPADGAIGVDGSREADRVLDLAKQVAQLADARLGRVYLTRNRDMNSTLEFRTTLGDALRVDVAVSVHLNAEGRIPLDRPGIETFAAVSDPQGRRLAGVMYAAQRRFLQQFTGPWVGYPDAGAKYRLSRRGGDYYGLLRRSHRPWVISESLFMTSAHDIALLDKTAFVTQLATVIADGARVFTTTRTPGSGWRKPRPPLPNPAPSTQPPAPPCIDPTR